MAAQTTSKKVGDHYEATEHGTKWVVIKRENFLNGFAEANLWDLYDATESTEWLWCGEYETKRAALYAI